MNIFTKYVVRLYQPQLLKKCNKRFCSSSTPNVVYFGCYPSEKNVQYTKDNYDTYYPINIYHVYYPTNNYEYYHTSNFTHYPSKFFTHHSNNGFIFF